ncbi:unnamed protein product [Rhizoctonia solani]|uniref:Uncharacterized protein n=1 Tax=Rhizoctonia solani TaxID=456999 RepID=A0A8H3HCD6_9AGAM|nr:unnamed protein product [Rhizoctonia solani]
MPSFGGFYVVSFVSSPYTLHPTRLHLESRCLAGRGTPRNPPYERWGSPAAEGMISKALWENGLGKTFRVTMVPVPASEPEDRDWGLIIYTKRSKKPGCFLQRPDSQADLNGKQMLQDILELMTTNWINLWYKENSTVEPFESQFMEPLIKAHIDNQQL